LFFAVFIFFSYYRGGGEGCQEVFFITVHRLVPEQWLLMQSRYKIRFASFQAAGDEVFLEFPVFLPLEVCLKCQLLKGQDILLFFWLHYHQ